MRTLLLGKNSDVYENRQYLLSRIDVNEGKKEGQMEDRGKIGEWIYNGLSLDHSGDWNGPETGSPRAGNEEFR
ncbi:hypothetical protein TNCV_4728031 [Trichonephila clavipes]|nr:hypothetical protein TNCV_4728031 [Trichonephila clavipes]